MGRTKIDFKSQKKDCILQRKNDRIAMSKYCALVKEGQNSGEYEESDSSKMYYKEKEIKKNKVTVLEQTIDQCKEENSTDGKEQYYIENIKMKLLDKVIMQ